MTTTIHEVAGQLRSALIGYIEATYHIGDPALLAQRRALLDELGVVHQAPYLESTPRYKAGQRFGEIAGLPAPACQLFEALARPTALGQRILYDPPYKHQSEAISNCLVEGRNLLIMTGTGSGKTESFLMPVLGRLANESSLRPASFAKSAMRAMILYPMNALVNDQLGRLRGIFGDARLVSLFRSWGGRPPRFARYTSRTPYAGLRTKPKDQTNLKPFADFFVRALENARDPDPLVRDAAQQLIDQLKERGKWPAKPDLERWYHGPQGKFWQDAAGNFIRAVTLEDDSELVTRHEVQAASPDLVVTNYSMLEYMMMRPVERPIFDQTRQWLRDNPGETFLLILDESHLYRGAGGAEVGLLLRRLRDRLDIPVERLQVICATASFEKASYAPTFASELTGANPKTFSVIEGDLLHCPGEQAGTAEEARLLASLDMDLFYDEQSAARRDAVEPLLKYRGCASSTSAVEPALLEALQDFGPLSQLVNVTMGKAQAVAGLGKQIFPTAPDDVADQALTNLAALATNARATATDASLLPCRVHTFFRGLRGLWVCMDPACTEIPKSEQSVAGKLFSQPTDMCQCGARVLEFYTCRVCGNAYARGYCADPESPTIVWSEPGAELQMDGQFAEELQPLDLLLASPGDADLSDPKRYDLVTGQIDPAAISLRHRVVHLPPTRLMRPVTDDDEGGSNNAPMPPGVFHRCAVCERKAVQGLSPVQDHETKGDQPFQVLLNRQIQVQPPSPHPATQFAPLRGRKVMAFSDSRQVAARLAPNLQTYSARDSLRPLMVRGWKRLALIPDLSLRIDDVYFAVLLAAHELKVRLRPELAFHEQFTAYGRVGTEVQSGLLDSNQRLRTLCLELRGEENPPEALLADILSTLRDRSLGLEPLGFASLVERAEARSFVLGLPSIPGVAETDDDKLDVVRAWIRCWNNAGFWLRSMPARWYNLHPDPKVRVESRSGKFTSLTRSFPSTAATRAFNEKWLPVLLKVFAPAMAPKAHRLEGQQLSLSFEGNWVRCADCKSVHRPIRLIKRCLDCGHASVLPLDPDTDGVFAARKGFYRNSVLDALGANPRVPMAIIAAEHTAQLNSAQKEDVFSKAEANELLFQDVQLPLDGEKMESSAIDVLSSTTTMEVGIDIGQLSGVAMRNMPPGRANYQQRAGRAGRRANAIASVVAFGGSDTHDEHFFSEPEGMISGPVIDPTLSIDNVDIARRHVRAFLLQSYHQAKILGTGSSTDGSLFSVLGKVRDFLVPKSLLSRDDFEKWLMKNVAQLRARVDDWLPTQLSASNRADILDNMIKDCLDAIDDALRSFETTPTKEKEADDQDDGVAEVQAEEGEERPAVSLAKDALLDTLLYKGVLPRYAFPTDVATFHVFDVERSTRFYPKLSFAPTQGLSVALTQYAPGKLVWISGKCYTSGAVYSPMPKERIKQWTDRKLHLECSRCGFAFLEAQGATYAVGAEVDCDACGGHQTLGPARHWFRPTGFAHPVSVPALTSPDDVPETSYATRAKLTMRSDHATVWTELSERVRFHTTRTHLLVSNTGPAGAGYSYCTSCGRIEASTTPNSILGAMHAKPYPDKKDPNCKGGFVAKEVVLGTDFITDVALFSLRLAAPLRLLPADSISHVALRTACEALSRAATSLLGIEAGEVLAEFRPALTPEGVHGLETEIFLYDTLPGGAGFSMQAASRGVELFSKALDLLKGCKQGKDCSLSCYRCLRSFRNRIDHGALDRHTGAALVEYLLTGALPSFESTRLRNSARLLFSDLLRQQEPGLVLELTQEKVVGAPADVEGPIIHAKTAAGRQIVFAASNPLRERQPATTVEVAGGQRATFVEINELLIRKNLAEAARIALDELRRP